MNDAETTGPPVYLIFIEMDVSDLERVVQKAILGGYIPLGNVIQISNGSFLQAVWMDLR